MKLRYFTVWEWTLIRYIFLYDDKITVNQKETYVYQLNKYEIKIVNKLVSNTIQI